MSDHSSIEWTQATWNVATGCTRVSEGCTHCYIERTPPFRINGRRFTGPETGATTGILLHTERLALPTRWRKARRIFVNSLSDLFHDDIPGDYIARVWAAMATAGQHTYQILTKRPARMRALLASAAFREDVETYYLAMHKVGPSRPQYPPAWDQYWPLPHVWLGVSTETQQWADIRVPILAETPAAVRFLSCEPLLGPVDLTAVPLDRNRPGAATPPQWNHVIHWLIAGGESGPNARPMHPNWVNALRYDCKYPNIGPRVPFFLKQWGEWAPAFPWHDDSYDESLAVVGLDGSYRPWRHGLYLTHGSGDVYMRRVGKKRAGRTLDGRTWDEYPQAVT